MEVEDREVEDREVEDGEEEHEEVKEGEGWVQLEEWKKEDGEEGRMQRVRR